MYLFFDTETTGKPANYKAPASLTGNWPRLVQIAWVLADEDGETVASKTYIVKPEGFSIPAESTRIHGITDELAMASGVSIADVIKRFRKVVGVASSLVAHNMPFDEKIVGAEMIRLGLEDSVANSHRICTMQASTNWCDIPGPYGVKWPSLAELHGKLFGCDFDGAHDAMNDTLACAKCFFELKRLGVIR